jgi:hypothetical protein
MIKNDGTIIVTNALPIYVSLLSLDMDTNAERFLVINRVTLNIEFSALVSPTGIAKKIMPVGFSSSSDLIIMILDDDLTYNAAVVDGVKLELVDIKTVNLLV